MSNKQTITLTYTKTTDEHGEPCIDTDWDVNESVIVKDFHQVLHEMQQVLTGEVFQGLINFGYDPNSITTNDLFKWEKEKAKNMEQNT